MRPYRMLTNKKLICDQFTIHAFRNQFQHPHFTFRNCALKTIAIIVLIKKGNFLGMLRIGTIYNIMGILSTGLKIGNIRIDIKHLNRFHMFVEQHRNTLGQYKELPTIFTDQIQGTVNLDIWPSLRLLGI